MSKVVSVGLNTFCIPCKLKLQQTLEERASSAYEASMLRGIISNDSIEALQFRMFFGVVIVVMRKE